ncbi:MAG: mRNA-binding ribosome synthesis protein nop7 [Cirrosporium novae-zelandiae]|nr:MAG: mRNA-binding ribosome synthesis protein nop7 [Cirrosporium novae-zelandiae]
MPKIKKKGTSGQAVNFITRTQAVRKLQISLPDFRRLCIFKGIYPREPRNKKKASKASTPSTTFYYTKDIQYLLHEPLIQKFRDHKALQKKVSRLLGRGQVAEAARIEKILKPKISLDHIVKERYPTFVDALRDLDDALNMLFLFANLPSSKYVPPKIIELCKRLCHEFEHYVITTHSLKKSFLSIKGIYYQASIQGQDILWVVPYKFVQRVTGDVDFRIMATFVEFYSTLLGFVNFRLYTTIGLVYPPKFSQTSDESGAELGAFTLEGQAITQPTITSDAPETNHSITNGSESAENQAVVDKTVAKLKESGEPAELESTQDTSTQETAEADFDKFEVTGPGADTLPEPSLTNSEAGTLFEPFTFFLSRETPRHSIEFLLRSFGCKRVGWDEVLGAGAFTHDETDPKITHEIVDRPPLPESATADRDENSTAVRPGTRIPGRTYVQPQWVWDCVNAGKLLRSDLYAPGAQLPPHLSPFIKATKGAYDPSIPLSAQEPENEIEEAAAKALEATGGDDPNSPEDDAHPSDSEASEDEEFTGFNSDVDVDDNDEITTAQLAHQRELEAEAAGIPFSDNDANSKKAAEIRKKAARKKKAEEEELQRQRMMMSNKKRRLVDQMMYSKRKGDKEAEKLRGKRRRIEGGGGGRD